MSVFVRYYRDWRSKYKVRFRWRITPAYTSALSYNTAPEYGAAATVGYCKVPNRCFYVSGDIEMTYDKRGHGTPDASDYKQAVNLVPLFDSSNSDLVDLATMILSPTHGGVAFPMASPTIGDTFQTSLCWELFTDDGDETKTISQFRRMYIGAIRQKTEKEMAIRRSNFRIRYEFDLVDISKLVLETVVSSHVSSFFLARMHNASFEPTNPTGASGCFYDVVYRNSGVNYARCLARRGPGYDKARYWKLKDLFAHMRILCDAVFCAYLRTDFDESTPRFRYIAYLIPGEPGFAFLDGHPYDMLQFFQQSYLKTGARSGTIISRDALCFMGVIWDDNVGGTDQTFDNAYDGTYSGGLQNFTGGFLVTHSEDNSIFAKDTSNLWDFFSRCARGLTRAQFRHTSDGIDFEFNPLNDAVDTPLALADLRVLPTDDTVPKMTARVVTGATVSMVGTSGDDKSSAEFKTGTLAEEEEQCTLIFHNSPTVGAVANRYQFNLKDQNPDLIGASVAGASTGYNPLVLCYFDSPTDITTNRIPIRPADQVRILTDAGIFGYIDGDVTVLPTPNPADIVSGQNPGAFFDDLFWYPMLASLSNAQKKSCLAYSMAVRLSRLFGNDKQWLLEEPIRFSVLAQRALGDRFHLSDGVTTGLNMLTDGRTYFTSYPANPVIVRAKLSISTGKTETELLANPI